MKKRPTWSLKSTFLFLLGLLLVVIPLVLFVFEKSIWVQLELVTTVIAGFMFLFLVYVLYHGIRFDKKDKFEFAWVGMDPTEVPTLDMAWYSPGTLTEAGSEGGLAGLVVGFLLDVILSLILSVVLAVLLTALFWLGVNIALLAITAICIPLFYIFNRSLRYMVWKGRGCSGRLGKAIRYAGLFTLAGSIWFYAILLVSHYIVTRPGPSG